MIYNVKNFPYKMIYGIDNVKRGKGVKGMKAKRDYKDLVCAFDIEATNLKQYKHAIMYVWQFQVDELFTVMGRTWQEFLEFLTKFSTFLKDSEWLVVYVHNLSYEYAFLSGIYDFQNQNVFAILPHKILNCEMFNHFEFRCSYIHSNMSLYDYTNKMKVLHKKLKGEEFNYNKIRYPWTLLTPKEIKYCVHDVKGLVEAIKKEMLLDGDTLYTIPATSTGYVRRDVKQAMRGYRLTVQSLIPPFECQKLLEKAFRGGNTHANRHVVDDTEHSGFVRILYNVKSRDMASAYPAAQMNKPFPMTPFIRQAKRNKQMIESCIRHNKPFVVDITLKNIKLRNEDWGAPYISKSKCTEIPIYQYDENGEKLKKKRLGGVVDNGRMLKAERLRICVTDIDYKIIAKEYEFEIESVNDLWTSTYGYLPPEMKEVIMTYFRLKTELKHETGDKAIYYTKAKNKLNSIYGMSAQNPIKQSILYELMENKFGEGWHKGFEEATEDEEELYEKYERKAFFCYQWGVWTTAWCRQMLEEGLDLIHEHTKYTDGVCVFVYCDTDSIKYIDEDNVIDWNVINNKRIEESTKNGAYADDVNGKRYYLGVYDEEPTAVRFKTMGAKRYAYEVKHKMCDTCQEFGRTCFGELKITIAGVGKKKGAIELLNRGGLEVMQDDFVFYEAGGTRAIYNEPNYVDGELKPLTTIKVGNRELPITANVYIEETTKTLDRTEEYLNITKLSTLFKHSQKALTNGG